MLCRVEIKASTRYLFPQTICKFTRGSDLSLPRLVTSWYFLAANLKPRTGRIPQPNKPDCSPQNLLGTVIIASTLVCVESESRGERQQETIKTAQDTKHSQVRHPLPHTAGIAKEIKPKYHD